MDFFGIPKTSQFSRQHTYHFSPSFIFLLKFQMCRYLEGNTMESDFELGHSQSQWTAQAQHCNIPFKLLSTHSGKIQLKCNV